MDRLNKSKVIIGWLSRHIFLFGLLNLAWFILRTGTKPSRSAYPCQQVAMVNSQAWFALYILPLFSWTRGNPIISAMPRKAAIISGTKNLIIVTFMLMIVASGVVYVAMWRLGEPGGQPEDKGGKPSNQTSTTVGLTITGRTASSQPASDIFVVTGTEGNDGGILELINLMGSKGLLFYQSQATGKNKGPNGLIASNDVVLIKVNCQWNERGGTSTDLLKVLIQAIVSHPDGFKGEIIVADNGQAQGGSSGQGGSLDWAESNAEDHSQSAQKVVDSFASSHKVSTYLWDTITTTRVNEYSEEDMNDGYVVNATMNPRTSIYVSYPKFRTKFGTYVSFKHGIWDTQAKRYDGARLKVINVPVLKTHINYGVTASVKHYMGVDSDKLTAQLGSRTHNTIGKGGMGTLMVETRFPILNIIDAIWINSVPLGGPWTRYLDATKANIIAASTDPVALDYWASKNILLQSWKLRSNSTSPTMDPDNKEAAFGSYLRLSMQEIVRAGYRATIDEARMNVHVANLH